MHKPKNAGSWSRIAPKRPADENSPAGRGRKGVARHYRSVLEHGGSLLEPLVMDADEALAEYASHFELSSDQVALAAELHRLCQGGPFQLTRKQRSRLLGRRRASAEVVQLLAAVGASL